MSEQFSRAKYLECLYEAQGLFEIAIQDSVSSTLTVRDRLSKPPVELCAGEVGHAEVRDRFVREVSSYQAVQLLLFLYKMKAHIQNDFALFLSLYNTLISPQRIRRVEYDFPRIDQTTITEINANISSTTVAYRLEDLSRIGLVKRSDLAPPDRKHTHITDEGIALVEGAIDRGWVALSPMFNTVPSRSKIRGAAE